MFFLVIFCGGFLSLLGTLIRLTPLIQMTVNTRLHPCSKIDRFTYFYSKTLTLTGTEREGFEPSLESPLNDISSVAPSTTRPPLQGIYFVFTHENIYYHKFWKVNTISKNFFLCPVPIG